MTEIAKQRGARRGPKPPTDDLDLGDAFEMDLGDAFEIDEPESGVDLDVKPPPRAPTPESLPRQQAAEDLAASRAWWAPAHEWARGVDRAGRTLGGPSFDTDPIVSMVQQAVDRPQDAAVGAAQGATFDFLDEILGGLAQGYGTSDATYLARLGSDEVDLPDPERQREVGLLADMAVDEATTDAQQMSPELYDLAYGAGATGTAMATGSVLPAGAGIQGVRGVVARPAIAAAYGAAEAGLGGAGRAQEGERLEGFAEAAPIGALYGGLGGVGGEILQGAMRSPGAMEGVTDTLQRHADDSRLSSSGIRGPQALREADQRFAPDIDVAEGTPNPQAGRRELARILREGHIGENALGIPTAQGVQDRGIEMVMETGPQVGNPLRGPSHMGVVESQLDALGAHVDMGEIADDIERSVAHEAQLRAGSAQRSVRALADQVRGVDSEALQVARTEADQLTRRAQELTAASRQAEANLAALPEVVAGPDIPETVAQEAARSRAGVAARVEVMLAEAEQARMVADAAIERANTLARGATGGPVRFSAGHMQRQAFQQRDFPGVPEVYLQRAADIVNEHLDEAARAVPTRMLDASGASINLGMMADRLASELTAEGIDPAVVDQLTRAMRRRGSVPVGQAQQFIRNLQAEMAPPSPGNATPVRRPGRQARVEVPPELVTRAGDMVSQEGDRVSQEWVQSAAERYAREQVDMEAQRLVREGQLVTEADYNRMLQEAIELGPPWQQWTDLNREYGLGRYLMEHASPLAHGGGPQAGLARMAAARSMFTGNPMPMLEQEALGAMTPMLMQQVRGAGTRLLEGAASGSRGLTTTLRRVIGTNPDALGPYARPLMDAMAQGEGAVAAYHYQQSMRDQEYRDMMDRAGIGAEGEDGVDPAVYDILTEGLTTEDVF
jgi:hypothetical protein